MMIQFVDQLAVEQKRVFVRTDFNVPLSKTSAITDTLRVDATLPTLRHLIDAGARLIVASHLGRPKGEVDRQFSLLPVAEYLTTVLSDEVIFPENCVGDGVTRLANELKPGQVMLLENLRFHAGETSNEPAFVEQLAALADVYVNDAFGTLHRAHASTVGVPGLIDEKGAGFLVKKELEVLQSLLEEPARPFWAVIGGAKVADKIGLIDKLLDKVDGIILGGGLAYSFLKAQGHEIGRSRFEDSKIHLAGQILERAKIKEVEVCLPIDHKVAFEIGPEVLGEIINDVEIPADRIALDIGPRTVQAFQKAIEGAKTIFWNGPLGFFENPNFAEGTREMAKTVAALDATSVVGGGDSVAALKMLGLDKEVSYISTGGGASLAFLEGRSLPGLKALETKQT